MALRKIFFAPTPDSPGRAPPSVMSTRGGIEFSKQLGFEQVTARKSISNGLSYYTQLWKTWKAAQLFMTLYPKFMGPLLSPRGLALNKANLQVAKILSKSEGDRKSILMVQDLPIDQSFSSNKNALYSKDAYQLESTIFRTFDVLCVFNSLMKERIMELYQIPSARFIEFEMHDYAVRFEPEPSKPLGRARRVVYAGNLGENYLGKWIEGLPEVQDISFEFIGFGAEWMSRIQRPDIRYVGFIPSYEKLTEYMSQNADFAIIAVSDDRKQYYEYTATSKFSASIVAGLPVVVPASHSYISSLVRRYDVGLVIDSVTDIPEQLKVMPEPEFKRLRGNCLRLAQKLRNGFFFKRAVTSALQRIVQQTILST